MKFAALALAAVAAVAAVDASAHDSNIHIRVHVHHAKQNDICYKQCPTGQWCARGPADKQKCRAPKPNSTECFNYATAQWIAKCDTGYECKLGKCELKGSGNNNNNNNQGGGDQSAGVPGGPICYKQCPSGQWCARGPTDKQTCRAPKPNSTECFDLSQGLWIPKCGAGFSCKQGKCA